MISTLWLSCHYLKTSSLLKILLKNRGTSTSTFRRTDSKKVSEDWRQTSELTFSSRFEEKKDWIIIMSEWKIAVKSAKNR